MKIEELLIGILVVTGIVSGIYFFVGNMANSSGYGVDINDSYMASYNDTAEISTSFNESFAVLSDSTFELQDVVEAIGIVWQTVKTIITTPFNFMTAMLNDTNTHLDFVPPWVLTMLVGMLSVLIIFSLIKILLRFKE